MANEQAPRNTGNPLIGLLFFAVVIIAVVVALVVLEPARPGQPDARITPMGTPGFVPHPRVVTLAPHLAELVYAAGAGDHLQAVTRYSDFPPPVKRLPVVGDAFALDYEKLLRLKPELVLAWAGGTQPAVIHKLERIGLTVLPVKIESLQDIGPAIQRIGTLLGTRATADSQAALFEQELALRSQRAKQMPQARAFIQTSDKPLYTVSRKHWISQALALCGLENVFAELPTGSAPVNPEAVIQRQPEVIVMLSQAADAAVKSARREKPEDTLWAQWEQLTAVRKGRIIRVNPDLLSRPSPRILQGVAAVCELLQPAAEQQ